MKEIIEDFQKLSDIQKEVLTAIEILNLNATELKESRRKFISNVKPIIDSANETELLKMKAEYETGFGKKFAGVALYFINEKLKKLVS